MKELSAYQEFLFHSLFASVATLAFLASLYLLLRRSNAFAPNINPPLRLRRWTAAFFASAGASHLWWLFIRYSPSDGDLFNRILLCTTFDMVSSAPILLCTMLVMLQDRRRPLWPIAVASALTLVYMLLIYIYDVRSTAFLALPFFLVFFFSIVLVRAVRQYDRWLLDNYADLEHKEAWTSIGIMAAFILTSIAYGFANDYFFFEVLIEVANILLIMVLLWRVETMQTLEEPVVADDSSDVPVDAEEAPQGIDPIYEKLQSLLQQFCEDEQYYLKHDVTLIQLAKHIGTNRNYLSQHFAHQGQTYNSYINDLRIKHFMRLYQEALADKRDFTLRKLAYESGFASYSTFSAAFKQSLGCSVTKWTKMQPC